MDMEKRFKGMLARIFSDGVLEPSEKKELAQMLASGGLTHEQARAVMTDFVEKTYRHVMADGVVTDQERAKLRLIVDSLALPDDCVPAAVRQLLS